MTRWSSEEGSGRQAAASRETQAIAPPPQRLALTPTHSHSRLQRRQRTGREGGDEGAGGGAEAEAKQRAAHSTLSLMTAAGGARGGSRGMESRLDSTGSAEELHG